MANELEFVRGIATELHKGQFRQDGKTPYITHPIEVQEILAEDGHDVTMQMAALLHDTLEDCPATPTSLFLSLQKKLSPDEAITIINLVIGMTSPDKLIGVKSLYNRAERKKMMRAWFQVASEDVATIKIYDRYTNIMDMKSFEEDFKRIYAKETLDLMDILGPRIDFKSAPYGMMMKCDAIYAKCNQILGGNNVETEGGRN